MKILLVLVILAIAMVAVTIISNRVPSFDEKRKGGKKSEIPQTPGAARAKKKLWPIIAIVLLGFLIWGGAGKKNALPPIQQAAAEFHLKAGEETPTVEVGQGTRHRLWADKPYLAVSVQKDGSRITYPMPDGGETWNGDEPGGRLRLLGVEGDTLVKIVSLK